MAGHCAAIIFALLLGACGTLPAPSVARYQPRPIPDDTQPPVIVADLTPRQRIVDIAQQEWRRWGSQVVSVGQDGHACVSEVAMPAGYGAVPTPAPDTSPGGETHCLSFADGSGMEATPQGCALALRYWHLLGREPDCEDLTQARWAWSAAFISWVIRQAGLTEAQFLVGQAHNLYVADVRDGVLPAGAFRIEPYPALPLPGDMICNARDSRQEVSSIEQIKAGHTAMHCDIVIDVDTRRHVVKAIGGNVQQSVSMSVIAWDKASRVTSGSGLRPWLLVMRNQLP